MLILSGEFELMDGRQFGDGVAEIEARASESERRAITAEIQLGITRARVADLEKSAAEAKDRLATAAVQAMVASGAIRRDDTFNQNFFKAQFLADAALMPLCLCKPFNQRKRVTK